MTRMIILAVAFWGIFSSVSASEPEKTNLADLDFLQRRQIFVAGTLVHSSFVTGQPVVTMGGVLLDKSINANPTVEMQKDRERLTKKLAEIKRKRLYELMKIQLRIDLSLPPVPGFEEKQRRQAKAAILDMQRKQQEALYFQQRRAIELRNWQLYQIQIQQRNLAIQRFQNSQRFLPR